MSPQQLVNKFLITSVETFFVGRRCGEDERTGLKILRDESLVPVRFRFSAPSYFKFIPTKITFSVWLTSDSKSDRDCTLRGNSLSQRPWFKHYKNAHQGHTLRTLWDSGDYEAYGFFWILHELITQFESEDSRGKVTFSWGTFVRETGWKESKCRRVLARISSVSKIETTEEREGYVTVLSPNWLKLQETAKKSEGAKSEQTPTEERGKKREERSKSKSDDFDFDFIYESYPRKSGKAEGISRLKKTITTWDDYDLFSLAVFNYAEICRRDKTPQKFIKQFSSFVGTKEVQRWRDYVDYTPVENPSDLRVVSDLPPEYPCLDQ